MQRAAAVLVMAAACASAAAAEPLRDYVVNVDSIARPLTGKRGDAERGRAIVGDRQVGLCLLCHSGPFAEPRLQGDIAPDLRGTGSRLSEGQIRLRIVDSSRINPRSIMPAYCRSEGLTRVASAWRGRPVLSAEQIEDVVAYLVRLRE